VVVVVFGLQQEQDYFSLHTSPIMNFSSPTSQLLLGLFDCSYAAGT
jgi:hypothetical protein